MRTVLLQISLMMRKIAGFASIHAGIDFRIRIRDDFKRYLLTTSVKYLIFQNSRRTGMHFSDLLASLRNRFHYASTYCASAVLGHIVINWISAVKRARDNSIK
uniref:Uncharacterized protein n=1 Tax=Glossina austeni TaxID=7395 RepID=A0A1A9VL92_GLOAU